MDKHNGKIVTWVEEDPKDSLRETLKNLPN